MSMSESAQQIQKQERFFSSLLRLVHSPSQVNARAMFERTSEMCLPKILSVSMYCASLMNHGKVYIIGGVFQALSLPAECLQYD